jgi:hypothetical protein
VLLVEIHVGEGKLLDRTCRRRRAPGRNRWGGERVQAAATDFGRGQLLVLDYDVPTSSTKSLS